MQRQKEVWSRDCVLADLQQKIHAGTAELLDLLDSIEQPEDPAVVGIHSARGVSNNGHQAEACSTLEEAGKQQRSLKRRRAAKDKDLFAPRQRPAFDLRLINSLIAQHVEAESEEALELPKFTTPQRKQVVPFGPRLSFCCTSLTALLYASSSTPAGCLAACF